MEESQIYRGVQDAFAPPSKQPYRDAPAQKAKEPSLAPPPTAPLLEDDALSWAAGPDDGDLAKEFATTGSLVIVDTGVMAVNQVTVEGKQWIEQSDRVLFLGTDPVNERWIRSLNQNLESLSQLETSDEIVERTLDHVRAGLAVCIAVHGRSAMSAEVSRRAIGQGRAEGFPAVVVPGVSELDCLSADLGVDLAGTGCQIFAVEAFLERRRPDPSVALFLYLSEDNPIGQLLEVLRSAYGVEQKAVLYEPARYAVLEPVIQHCTIGEIDEADLARASIFYIPPKDADG